MPLKNILNNIKLNSKDSKQIQLSDDYLNFLKKHNDFGFVRKNQEGHFTGSMIVINKDVSKILLMHHKKLNKWLNFGGHADGDTNILNVAIRELEEEAGININETDIEDNFVILDKHIIPERKNELEHYHYDVRFIVRVDDNISFIKQESEVNDIKWFNIIDILGKNKEDFPGVLSFIKRVSKLKLDKEM